WPTFLPHRFVAKYLNMYCDHFDLRKYIRFSRNVVSVTPEFSASGKQTGRWEVVTQKCRRRQIQIGSGPSRPTSPPPSRTGRFVSVGALGSRSLSRHKSPPPASPSDLPFRAPFDLAAAAGRGSTPRPTSPYDEATLMTSPPVEGYENVENDDAPGSADSEPAVKSRAETFDFVMDSKVLVIGVGSSGLDIASELSHHARQVVLSSRSGAWVLPRFTLFGLPTDHLSSRAASALPRSITNLAVETLTRLQVGNLERFGLKPDLRAADPAGRGPAINSDVLDRIGSGRILVRPNVRRFVGAYAVEFDDGTVEEVDTVVYCTGYVIDHPFLNSAAVFGPAAAPPAASPPTEKDPAVAAPLIDPPSGETGGGATGRVRLFKHVMPPHYRNLAFIGLVQPTGAIMPVAEMQARWASRVFAGAPGTPPLPPPVEMLAEVTRAEAAAAVATPGPTVSAATVAAARERQTIHVDYVQYMDELAALVGCKPDLWKMWRFGSWQLAAMVTFGPAVPAQYRLAGPSAWDGAERAITDACAGYDFRKIVGYQAAQRLRDDRRQDD
ncbi:hypothetical protein HK405_007642, partial [Cladochytrium tenue]